MKANFDQKKPNFYGIHAMLWELLFQSVMLISVRSTFMLFQLI